MTPELVITDHARERLYERAGFDKNAQDRMALKAFENGKHRRDFRGAFGKYLDYLLLKRRAINNLRVYGEFIYLFAGNILVTVLFVPPMYKKALK